MTPSKTRTPVNTATRTRTPVSGQATVVKPSATPTWFIVIIYPSATSSPTTVPTSTSIPSTITLDPNLTPMLAGGLQLALPTGTPATPWLETVIAAASQTAAAEYKSPTPTEMIPNTPTATVTLVEVSAPVQQENQPAPTPPQTDLVPMMFLYFACGAGGIVALFLAYLRFVVFGKPMKGTRGY